MPPQVMATLHLDGQARKLDLSYRHGISLTRSRVSKSFSAITAAAALDLTEEDPLAAYERERLSHKERAAERELREEELQQVLAFLGGMEIGGDGVYTQKSARRGTGGEGTASGAGGEVLELVMSARRSYLLLFSDPRDRDLLILTMRAYLREWPPKGPKGSELATARPPPLQLSVELHSGSGLMASDFDGKSDPYVAFHYGGREVAVSRVQPKTLNPVWNQTLMLAEEASEASVGAETLRLVVFDEDTGTMMEGFSKGDDVIGEASVALQPVLQVRAFSYKYAAGCI